MVGNYFSDSERGAKPRTKEDIPDELWGGIVGLIGSELSKQSFAIDFPEKCPDGGAVCDTDQPQLMLLLEGEIPQAEWPPQAQSRPDKFVVLDLVQFCFRHIGDARHDYYHPFFRHHHLSCDRQTGQDRFREAVNLLFSRNGVVFELTNTGDIVRLGSPIFQEAFERIAFSTGDTTLDSLLEDARRKFTSPEPKIRREGLEKLWDAWERAKTMEPGKDKKESTKKILDRAAAEPNFRDLLETEAKELTRIGNEFRIRHSETSKTEINESQQVDYLFYRMFTMINLLPLPK
ncbi:MAG: hypothetical protein AABY45_10225 [Deltaproteobacteria bacterium]